MPKTPLARSPRQCIAPELRSPRKVCVVIGPFIGWKSSAVTAVDWPPYPEEDFSEGDRPGVAEVDRYRILLDGVVGIAQVPGEVVIIAEDVATRARRLAVAENRVAS